MFHQVVTIPKRAPRRTAAVLGVPFGLSSGVVTRLTCAYIPLAAHAANLRREETVLGTTKRIHRSEPI
jgi:hypothetical protein